MHLKGTIWWLLCIFLGGTTGSIGKNHEKSDLLDLLSPHPGCPVKKMFKVKIPPFLQGGPLIVISGVIIPINGLING